MRKLDLNSDLVAVLKKLRLGRMIPVLPERLRQARERQMDPEDVLLLILSDETQRRERQRFALRRKVAGLSPVMVFDEWDKTASITYDSRLLALRRLDVMETADLYELVTGRHRGGSMVITSNRTPEEWLGMLADPMLAQALVDRFSNNAYDLVIEGESYRKRQKPQLTPTDAAGIPVAAAGGAR